MKLLFLLLLTVCLFAYSVKCACTPEVEAEISPCTCYNSTLNCSLVISAEELANIQLSGNWDFVYLQNSPIEELPSDAFGTVRGVRFYINYNNITTVEEGFLGESDPDELDLSDNFITDLPYEYLKEMRNMLMLNLDRNQLTQIPSKAFDGVGQLVQVSLNENIISSLGWRAFTGQRNLQHIGMSNNYLTFLPNYGFIKETRINGSYLDLSTNQISSIQPLAFGGEYFDTVNLMYNYISDMERLTFEKMIVYMSTTYNQPKIHMTGNPLSCNCTAEWLYNNGEDYGVFYEMVVPSFPCQEYGGAHLWDLPADSFDHCPCE